MRRTAPSTRASSPAGPSPAAPGGAGNKGGSFLAITKYCKNPKAAFAFISWLESAKNQAQAFLDPVLFPSTPATYTDKTLTAPDPFFGGQQIVDVFRADGWVAPVFNDKHLSWKFEWAKEMVDTAREMKFPFLAGSSLPVTWRMPSIDLPYGAEVEEVLGVAMGPIDIYDFHALEMIQCMAERRRGGETGVVAIHALRGESVWDALAAGSWQAGGWDPATGAATGRPESSPPA